MQKFLRFFMLVALLLPFALRAQVSLPINMDFEDAAAFGQWTMTNCHASSGRNSSAGHEGSSYGFRFYYTTTPPQYLISPEFTAANGTEMVSFWYKAYSTSYTESFEIGFSSTTNDVDAFEWGTSVNVTSTTWAEYTALVPEGTKYVAIKSTAYDAFYLYIDDIYIGAPPACSNVATLTVGETTTNSITLNWTDDLNDGATYTIYNMSDTSVIEANLSGNSYTVEDLTANTLYTFGIKAFCDADESSNGYATASARTQCTSFAYPYTWDFEDMTTSEAPSCWEKVGEGSAVVTTSIAHSGNNKLYFSGATSNLIMLPPTEDEINTLQMKFWIRPETNSSYCGNFSVGYVADGNFTALATYNYTDFIVSGSATYLEHAIMFSSAPEGARMALRAEPTSTNYYWYVDDVTIDELPSCIPVSVLAIDAEETTANSLTLTWLSDATDFIIINMANGEEVGTSNTNSFEATDLDANTAYTFGVVVDCGGEYSDTIIVNGRTACDVISTLPYSMGFEANDLQGTTSALSFPYCWTRINTLPSTSTYYYYPYVLQSNPHEGDRSLYFYAYQSTYSTYADTVGFILPELDVNTYPMNGNRVTFWAKVTSSTPYNVFVGTMSDPADMSTFSLVDSVSVSSTIYEMKSVSLAEANEEDAYVAFLVPKVYASMYIDDVTLEIMPTCMEVSNVNAIDSLTTPNSITITWVDTLNPAGTEYTIYNMADTSVIENVNIEDNVAVIEGLNPNSAYTFGVQANCGDGDAHFITVSHRTSCAPMPLPFNETFDVSASNNPCWAGASGITADEVLAGSALTLSTPQWTYASSTQNGLAAHHYYVNIYGTSCKYWIITPEIDLGEVENPLLTFDAAFTVYTSSSNEPASGFESNTSQAFKVLVTTDGGQTWTLASNINLSAIASSTYLPQYVDLSDYAGDTVRIAFYAQSTVSGGDNNLHIDNIEVNESTGDICYAVNDLAASAITSESATLTWEGDADGYDIEVRKNNTLIYSETVYDTTVTIEDLEAENSYTVSVRSNCGDENVSAWITVNVYTGYCLPNPTSRDDSGITNVSFGGMTNTTHPSAAPFYGNYTTMAGSVPAGTTATVEITYATGYTYGTIIWVDWNNNLMFDGDEVVYAGESTSSNPTTLTAEFDIPATIEEGNYRMRIAGADSYFDNYTSSLTTAANANPCFSSTYSVAEDYTLTVTEAPSCLAVTNLTVDSVTATSVFLSWTDELNSGATYTIYDMADTSEIATGVSGLEYEVEDLESTTSYTFGVAANCSSTDFSLFATVNATTDCANGSCEITIVGSDQYNDSWNNASIKLMQAGIQMGTFSVASGASPYTATFSVCSGAPVSFVWVDGSYDSECNFTIYDGAGTIAYTGNGSSLAGTFFTLADACPTCIAPAVTVETTTEAAITISWTGEAESFDIYQDGEFVESTTANTYTFNGLNPSSSYVLGVQAICSETDSSVMTTVNAATDCPDITSLPYHESFEDGLGCWRTVNGSSDGRPWNAQGAFGDGGSITAHTGSYMASSWSWNSSAMHANAWLISPKFVLPTVTDDSLTLSWWHRVSANYPHELYDVMISTTTNDTAAFATTLLAVSPDSTSEWIQNIVDLTTYAGQEVYVAFHHHDSYDQNYLLIDDIELFQGGYVPPTPDTLTVTFAVNDATMGTTIPAPGTYQYIEGDTVSFGSQANAGYHFAYWVLNDGTSIDTLDTHYANGYALASSLLAQNIHAISFTAYFEAGNPDSTTITYAVNDPTMGTITPTPGTYTIYVGDNITTTATPNDGYVLSAWVFDTYLNGVLINSDTTYSDDPEFENPMNFGSLPQSYADYEATITITALFEAGSAPTLYTVTVNSADLTMGTVTSSASGQVAENTSVTVTATPAEGYHFVAWMNGTTQVSTENPYTFTVTSDITLTATFEANDPVVTYYTVTVNSADLNMGTVTSTASGQVAENTSVTVTATPAEGYHFVAWMNGDAQVSTENPYTFTVTGNITLTATFEANDPVVTYYEVTVNSADLNMGTVTSTASGQVAENTEVTVTATPAEGYIFVAWMNGNDTVSTENPYTFTVTGDITLTAVFQYGIGIDDFDFSNVNVYSTKSTIIVNGAENQDIFVYDMNGRCIYKHFNANETERINVLSAGAYLVRISNGVTKKVVVVK